MPVANQGPENRDGAQRPGRRWQRLAHGRWERSGHVVDQPEEARVHRSRAARCQGESPGGWLALPSAPRGSRKHGPPIPTPGRTQSRETLVLGVHLVPVSLLGGPPSRQAQEACVTHEDVHVHLLLRTMFHTDASNDSLTPQGVLADPYHVYFLGHKAGPHRPQHVCTMAQPRVQGTPAPRAASASAPHTGCAGPVPSSAPGKCPGL
ncbi:hypothetical protein MDA_GLEAN10011726 [Myotis davidii]|uniref:Uncharacterized protein n=1 Tax=Myotis davidii TaxID=225400 RepID=L5MFS3_MYODS|nr:hypothetical protein MDA_GLEAN10011726 [Myotis davidii]